MYYQITPENLQLTVLSNYTRKSPTDFALPENIQTQFQSKVDEAGVNNKTNTAFPSKTQLAVVMATGAEICHRYG